MTAAPAGRVREIIDRERRRASPSGAQVRQKAELAAKAKELIAAAADGQPGVVGIEEGGSHAKGTWLPESADIDVYVKFAAETPPDAFEKAALRIGFEALKDHGPYTRFSDHPFVECVMGDTRINSVPCYDVREGAWKSAADRSPFHTRLMARELAGEAGGEARVLKRFMAAGGIYGAEIATQGFSGYACEVLVLNYGSFESVARAMAAAEPGLVVGAAAKRFSTPVAIMDPVDRNRNLAAAISMENMGRLVLLCRGFLEKPSGAYFGRGARRGRGAGAAAGPLRDCVAVGFGYGDGSPDAAWGMAKRAGAAVETQMEEAGFAVARRSVQVRAGGREEGRAGGEAWLAFLLESYTIPAHRVREGPAVFGREAAARFVAKNRRRSPAMWIGGDGRIMALESSAHTEAGKFLEELLAGGLDGSGVPRKLAAGIRKGGARIVRGGGAGPAPVKRQLLDLASTDAALLQVPAS